MKVYLIGNPLVAEDSLPVRLKPDLAKALPQHEFVEIDPTENFLPEEGSVIIDSVQGLNDVQFFNSFADFSGHKLISPHDYDLFFHLQFLLKLGKIRSVNLIGIPVSFDYDQAFAEIVTKLASSRSDRGEAKSISSSESGSRNSCTGHRRG